MEVDIEGGLKVEIDEINKTAALRKIPKESDTLIVPRYAEYKNQKYKITSIDFRFNSYRIKFLTFPEDSEVEIFKENCFNATHINKLRIPPKLKKLENGWGSCLEDLTDIEISPKNHNFIYYKNSFLLGKSHETKMNLMFSILHDKTLKMLSFLLKSKL